MTWRRTHLSATTFTALVAVPLLAACGADPAEVGRPGGLAPPTTVDPVAVEVYARACAECHGDRGEGVERFGPALEPDVLAARYTTLDEQVEFVLAGGEGGMPRFEGRLGRASLTAAVLLTRTGLDTLGPLPQQTDIDAAQIYATACARCHGVDGEGDLGPALAGGEALRRFPNVEDQVDWVTFGGADMPAFRGSLTQAEIRAVVEYTRTELG